MTPISVSETIFPIPVRSPVAGFTLLEILLVLTILGMASVLVVPNLGGLEIRTFNAQVRGAVALLNYSRRTAVVQGQPAIANFHSAGFEPPELSAVMPNVASWKAGAETTLRFRDSTGQETEIDDMLEISFYPEGGSSGGTLLLQFDEQEVAIDIDPFSGRVTSTVVTD